MRIPSCLYKYNSINNNPSYTFRSSPLLHLYRLNNILVSYKVIVGAQAQIDLQFYERSQMIVCKQRKGIWGFILVSAQPCENLAYSVFLSSRKRESGTCYLPVPDPVLRKQDASTLIVALYGSLVPAYTISPLPHRSHTQANVQQRRLMKL